MSAAKCGSDNPGCRLVCTRLIRATALIAAIVLTAATAAPALAAGDVKAGRQKALQCQTCHGMDGTAKIPEAPNLAGQSEIYLTKSLQDYRSGARKNEMMSIVAQTLKDQDIADLAGYFAAIPVTLGEPPK
ncbi:MAG: cytochrome c [Hyphomicrobiales bacterium]|nr:cytochrome c [Hyphomicrobiales bacterium]MBV9427402.1 cytochrome c [Bradyrhizobiaceae bacterium]